MAVREGGPNGKCVCWNVAEANCPSVVHCKNHQIAVKGGPNGKCVCWDVPGWHKAKRDISIESSPLELDGGLESSEINDKRDEPMDEASSLEKRNMDVETLPPASDLDHPSENPDINEKCDASLEIVKSEEKRGLRRPFLDPCWLTRCSDNQVAVALYRGGCRCMPLYGIRESERVIAPKLLTLELDGESQMSIINEKRYPPVEVTVPEGERDLTAGFARCRKTLICKANQITVEAGGFKGHCKCWDMKGWSSNPPKRDVAMLGKLDEQGDYKSP